MLATDLSFLGTISIGLPSVLRGDENELVEQFLVKPLQCSPQNSLNESQRFVERAPNYLSIYSFDVTPV